MGGNLGLSVISRQQNTEQGREGQIVANKPLSALQPTTNLSTNMDLSRMRSSSASHFSLQNNQDSLKRITHLENKLSDYNEQILQANIKLN